MNPKVSVYITNHNYGRFLQQAVESVLHQKFTDWELIVIDDGSKDESPIILQKYQQLPNVHLVRQERRGLIVSSNIALRLSKGAYLIRLDADDYLDENALLVLSNVLDTHPEVGLVYSDYYRIDETGEMLSLERRNKLGKEITLYDIPAHGACTMIRKSCLLEIGGYSEDISCHDGYDLWVKFLDRYGIYNVNVPLFYYRQHRGNQTRNRQQILRTRRFIQNRQAQQRRDKPLEVIGIIPVRSQEHEEAAYALRPLAGRALIDYTLDAALASEALRRIVVVSEDEEVLAYARQRSGVTTLSRPSALGRPNTPIEPTLRLALDQVGLETPGEAFMLLYVNSPLRKEVHIQSAIDTMRLFSVDSVISVYEDFSNHYQHVGLGLRPLFQRRRLRLEKEALWVENGAVYLSRAENLSPEGYLGERIGHIVMLRHESLQIDAPEDALLIERLLELRRSEREALPHG